MHQRRCPMVKGDDKRRNGHQARHANWSQALCIISKASLLQTSAVTSDRSLRLHKCIFHLQVLLLFTEFVAVREVGIKACADDDKGGLNNAKAAVKLSFETLLLLTKLVGVREVGVEACADDDEVGLEAPQGLHDDGHGPALTHHNDDDSGGSRMGSAAVAATVARVVIVFSERRTTRRHCCGCSQRFQLETDDQ
jgi:hypothetical protein